MRRLHAVGTLCLLALVAVGCQKGPDMGIVKGQVTMDGEPLANALVTFTPAEGGPAATGTTDANGQYELLSLGQKGAVLGQHKVTITTLQETPEGIDEEMTEEEYMKMVEEGGGPAAYKDAEITEKIPAKYNTQSELTAEVTSGENTINFELTSS